jgi:hypothetical protein
LQPRIAPANSFWLHTAPFRASFALLKSLKDLHPRPQFAESFALNTFVFYPPHLLRSPARSCSGERMSHREKCSGDGVHEKVVTNGALTSSTFQRFPGSEQILYAREHRHSPSALISLGFCTHKDYSQLRNIMSMPLTHGEEHQVFCKTKPVQVIVDISRMDRSSPTSSQKYLFEHTYKGKHSGIRLQEAYAHEEPADNCSTWKSVVTLLG